MNPVSARGFFLSAVPYAEADRIAQLYTLQLGRVRARIKGARKPQSRLASSLDLFTESGFSLFKRGPGDFYLLGQARVLNSHPGLKKDFPSLTALQMMADAVLQSIHEAEPHPEVYSLLQETLSALEFGAGGRELLPASFALRLLELLGHPLELDSCAGCGCDLRRKEARLVPHRGGALCRDCCPSGPRRMQVSPAGLEVLRKLRTLRLSRVHVLKLRPVQSREVLLAALEYLGLTVERPLKSLDYYLKVTPGPA